MTNENEMREKAIKEIEDLLARIASEINCHSWEQRPSGNLAVLMKDVFEHLKVDKQATDQILALFKENILGMVEVDKDAVYNTMVKSEYGRKPYKTSPEEARELAEAISKGNVIRMKEKTKCKQCGYVQEKLTDGYCNQCAMDKGLMDNPFPC